MILSSIAISERKHCVWTQCVCLFIWVSGNVLITVNSFGFALEAMRSAKAVMLCRMFMSGCGMSS